MEKFKKLITITVSLVCTVLILTSFGFYYISVKSTQDEAREEIERLSEKQQILSQQILKNVLLALSDKNLNNTTSRSELRALLVAFNKQHQFISKHVADAGLGSNHEKVQLTHLIQEAAPAYAHIVSIANTALSPDLAALTPGSSFLREINRSEFDFLDKLS